MRCCITRANLKAFLLSGCAFLYMGRMCAMPPAPSSALQLLHQMDTSRQSPHWPQIPPAALYHNIEANIHRPDHIYQGSATNFCGYAAFAYLMATYYPERYVQLLLDLYENGKARCGSLTLQPSFAIRQVAGGIQGHGKLDLHVADQLLFFTLADEIKGYLNLADRRYDAGNENTIWAATNYRKFNRMVRRMLQTPASARGTDIIRPQVGNRFVFINEQLAQGPVVLYVNSKYLYPSRHSLFRLRAPTHFIVLEKIEWSAGAYLVTYWDYGSKTFQAMNEKMLRKLVFGVTTLHLQLHPKPAHQKI